MTRLAARKGVQQRTRVRGLASRGSRSKCCIVAKGGDFGSQYSALRLRYGAAMLHDTTLGAATRVAALSERMVGARVAIEILYRDRKGPTTRCCIVIQCCDTALA